MDGPARYLLAILKSLKVSVTHFPPSHTLEATDLLLKYDAVILSDYPKQQLGKGAEQAIADQVVQGTGLLMIGGWASFAGNFGGWRGSRIEQLLPVSCLDRDDRMNTPGGAMIIPKIKNGLLRSLSFKNPPMICGFNHLKPKKDAAVILSARRIIAKKGASAYPKSLKLEKREFPVLVTSKNLFRRTAALATDVAPHWCGGLVDWGTKRVKLSVEKGIEVEVGHLYVQFFSNLIQWLTHQKGA